MEKDYKNFCQPRSGIALKRTQESTCQCAEKRKPDHQRSARAEIAIAPSGLTGEREGRPDPRKCICGDCRMKNLRKECAFGGEAES